MDGEFFSKIFSPWDELAAALVLQVKSFSRRRTMTEKEFTAAAEQHLDMVYRIALNCLRNPADAEDAAQTAMLRLWRSGQAFPDDNQLRHWLVRVTVNACKDALRSPWRRRMVPSWVHSTRERPSKVWTAPSFITQRKRHSTMVASSR